MWIVLSLIPCIMCIYTKAVCKHYHKTECSQSAHKELEYQVLYTNLQQGCWNTVCTHGALV